MTEYKYKINGNDYAVTIDSISDNAAKVTVNGKTYDVEMEKRVKDSTNVSHIHAYRPSTENAETIRTMDKSLKSPLPGTITGIKVKEGEQVKEGQTVAILEAMKMENEILSEYDGTVVSIHVEKGESVLEGSVIITIK